MLVGLLETKTNQRPEEALKTYWSFAPLPIRQALRWLSDQKTFTAHEEAYTIMPGMRAIVKDTETKPHHKEAPEAHRNEYDCQFLDAGSELIKWSPTSLLKIRTPYDKDKDVTMYDPDPRAALLFMQPGMFAVFAPGDAHAPELMTGKRPERIIKVIIKIHKNLFPKKTSGRR